MSHFSAKHGAAAHETAALHTTLKGLNPGFKRQLSPSFVTPTAPPFKPRLKAFLRRPNSLSMSDCAMSHFYSHGKQFIPCFSILAQAMANGATQDD